MAASVDPTPPRIGVSRPSLLRLRPEIEAATGARLVPLAVGVDAVLVRDADHILRAAARRLHRPWLLVGPGPFDAPRTAPRQGPTSLVLRWQGLPAVDLVPDTARIEAGLALLGRLKIGARAASGRVAPPAAGAGGVLVAWSDSATPATGRRLMEVARRESQGQPVFLPEGGDLWAAFLRAGSVVTEDGRIAVQAAAAGRLVVFCSEGHGEVLSPSALRGLFARHYLDEPTYFDAWKRRPISFEESAEQVAWLRERYQDNARRFVLVGVARWKRRSIESFLTGPNGPPVAVRSPAAAVALAARQGGAVASWVTRMPPNLPDLCERAGVPLWRMEDGFIRSVGLGASFRPGSSVVVDGRGMYFDPRRDSDLRHILATTDFTPDLLGRAARLRAAITTLDLSKYNVGLDLGPLDLPSGRRLVLVSGQVEDDASVQAGSGKVRTNLALLEAARARNPGDVLLYKAHPDVEAGFRTGGIPVETARRHADLVVDGLSIAALLRRVDHVETMTSLTGFEALLRGRSVAVHGRPFYAGWGLTEEADGPFDRGRALTLDELVAGTLILYPRYLDPVTSRPCAPELLIERLSAARAAEPPSRLALSPRALTALRWRHALLGPLARRLRGAPRP